MKAYSVGPTTPGLLQARRRALLTQSELAERAGLTNMTISHLEAGAPGRPSTIRRLAAALGVEPRVLLGED